MFRNLSIYIIPFIVGIISTLVTILIASIGTFSSSANLGERGAGIYFLLFISYTFFGLFFYYVLVYLIASAVGNWFYWNQGTATFSGCASVFNHVGSFTFASLIITAMKILRAIVDNGMRSTDNLMCCLCLCLVQCFLTCIEALLKTLNHFAVILMSYTGQDFVDSAKTGSVIFFS